MKILKYTSTQLKEALESLSEREKAVIIGGTRYNVDRNGNFSGPINDGNPYDTIVCGSNTYQCHGSLSFEESPTQYDQNGWPVYGTLTEIVGGGEKGLFEFLSDNTDVEFTASWNGGSDAGCDAPAHIATVHSSTTSNAVLMDGYDTHAHSHAGGNLTASNTDLEGVDNFEDKGYKNLYTYGKNKYKKYN